MLNAIQFLESIGSEPALGCAFDKLNDTAAHAKGHDGRWYEAFRGDREEMDCLLGERKKMMCLIMSPDDAPGRRDDEEKDGDGDPGDDSSPEKS